MSTGRYAGCEVEPGVKEDVVLNSERMKRASELIPNKQRLKLSLERCETTSSWPGPRTCSTVISFLPSENLQVLSDLHSFETASPASAPVLVADSRRRLPGAAPDSGAAGFRPSAAVLFAALSPRPEGEPDDVVPFVGLVDLVRGAGPIGLGPS